ncbi:hypothetical protein RhiirC2_740701 [Rhizophagus irregularis]|uniref:Uncharacterized protein n=1 Tax=Rhizophagus irregularis TaxID=588596 RepID=A0A2N1NI15_9GLOM|nr:hypothetical protein RhiirC2_740701 [Rhizophagus irregularis]
MSNTDITLNCLIIPSGFLDRVSVTITVPTAIQNELVSPCNDTPLDIRQIHYPGNVDEKRMQTQVLIPLISKEIPTDLYHIVASPIPHQILRKFFICIM